MSDEFAPPANLRVSDRFLRLLSRAKRMRIQRDALGDTGERWLADYFPKRFERSYATAVLGYSTSQKRSRIASRRGSYIDADGVATSEPLTYDEKKRNLQGHDQPLVWTGRLRQLAMEQARVLTTAVRGTDDVVRARITFGRLAVGGPGQYVNIASAGVPRVIRDTFIGRGGLPAAEVQAIARWYRDGVLDRIRGLAPTVRKLPPPPPAVADRREQIAAARAAQLAGAMRGRESIRQFRSARAARLASARGAGRADAGGSAGIGVPARDSASRRAAHRVSARLSYYRRRSIVLARRRARYRQLNTTHARAARRALGLT